MTAPAYTPRRRGLADGWILMYALRLQIHCDFPPQNLELKFGRRNIDAYRNNFPKQSEENWKYHPKRYDRLTVKAISLQANDNRMHFLTPVESFLSVMSQ